MINGKILLNDYIDNNGSLCLAQEMCNNNKEQLALKVLKIIK